jgi:hypothetical protein
MVKLKIELTSTQVTAAINLLARIVLLLALAILS